MSNEIKPTERSFEFPMMPIFGVELGERFGELTAIQKQTRIDVQELKAETKSEIQELKAEMKSEIQELKAEMKAIDTKFEAKTDKMAYALNRLDERTKAMQNQIMVIGGGTLVAVLAGIILQFFYK